LDFAFFLLPSLLLYLPCLCVCIDVEPHASDDILMCQNCRRLPAV
jgi:hypothetical protein